MPPPTHEHIMFFPTKVIALLTALAAMSSILIMTTTTVVIASSAATIGGTNDLSLVRKIKNSKKQSLIKNTADTCTMDHFLGTSQYSNCEGELTEVNIACANMDDTATATNTTPNTRLCSFSEHPVPYEDDTAAASAVECGDHGSFDPRTHLTTDHATGKCRLNFIALTDSCDAAPGEAGESSRFGVMVEVSLSTGTGTGTGPQNNEHNADPHKDNSGMLLRFSNNAGETYYNHLYPRTTVFLDRSSPQQTRTLGVYSTGCTTPCGRFDGESVTNPHGRSCPFKTCYQWKEKSKYCWTQSYMHSHSFYPCVPKHYTGDNDGWHDVDPRHVNPVTHPYSCGDPCQEHYGLDWNDSESEDYGLDNCT